MTGAQRGRARGAGGSGLPDPLTPADSDLRDFRFMPLDVVRFAQSDLVSFEDPAAIVAAILLWGASWHGLPAGSLTDDDRALCRLAGYGRGGSEWDKVRSGALRGWVKCSDGRLYHPVVAEKVVESWTGRLKQRHRTFCAAIRKHNERNPEAKLSAPTFEEWDAAGRAESVTRDGGPLSRVTDPSLSRSGHAEKRSKGQGQGQGQGYILPEANASGPAAPVAAEPNVEKAAETHLWTAGKTFLISHGTAKAQAGSLIGKWKGRYGTSAVIEALGVAQREPNLVDPVPFIEKVLKRRAGDDGFSIGGTRMNSPC